MRNISNSPLARVQSWKSYKLPPCNSVGSEWKLFGAVWQKIYASRIKFVNWLALNINCNSDDQEKQFCYQLINKRRLDSHPPLFILLPQLVWQIFEIYWSINQKIRRWFYEFVVERLIWRFPLFICWMYKKFSLSTRNCYNIIVNVEWKREEKKKMENRFHKYFILDMISRVH